MRILSEVIAGLLLLLLALWMAAGIYFWLGWPEAFRTALAIITIPFLLILWFLPRSVATPPRWIRRGVVLVLIAVFFTAYFSKSPYPRDWVPLHDELALAQIDSDLVTISNFRRALHYPDGRAPDIVWEERTFDLSQLTGAEIILQPFGESELTVHVLVTFTFADGNNLAASVEARRVTWEYFDALAGFFRSEQLYIVLGSETDLFGKRLANEEELQIYQTQANLPLVRAYLETLLSFTNDIHTEPAFYSTISESCLTTLLKLSPEFNQQVSLFDYRRWVPGYALGLFQEIGLVDNSISETELKASATLDPTVTQPFEYEGSEQEWSAYIRQNLGV